MIDNLAKIMNSSINDWIKITDRLPEKYQEVILCINNKYRISGFMVDEHRFYEYSLLQNEDGAFDVSVLSGSLITHWTPNPEDEGKLMNISKEDFVNMSKQSYEQGRQDAITESTANIKTILDEYRDKMRKPTEEQPSQEIIQDPVI